MNVYDLPAARLTHEDERPPTNRLAAAIEFEGHHRRSAEHLDPNVPRHDVQVWRPARLPARRLEHCAKARLDLLPPVEPVDARRLRDVWVEDGHIVGERAAERFPVQIVERGDEARERALDVAARVATARGWLNSEAYHGHD